MRFRRGLQSFCLTLLAIAILRCAQKPEGYMPVLEETSIDVLQTKTEEVMNQLHVAQSKALTEPDDAREALDSAEEKLHCISAYYLPLLDAREHAYNAYRFYYLIEKERATSELDRVENILMSMAENGDSHLVRELENPLEISTDAKAALLADSEEAPELLRDLANKVNLMFLRIDLILQGTR